MGTQVIYLKEQVNNAVFDRNKQVIPFHEIGSDFGGIKLDSERDAALIEDIEKAIAEHRGGVYKSSEAEYEKKKQEPIWRPSVSASDPLRVFSPPRQPQTVPDAPVAVGKPAAPPAPATVPNPAMAIAQELSRTPLSAPVEQDAANTEMANLLKQPVAKPRMGRATQAKVAETA